ncbi:tetratricopeptide repeat protein [Candidatus Fermentibacterales bacterium]|nr:tetratricopeptide repeat protein [Candidatus Fermentibacterales bacterium]
MALAAASALIAAGRTGRPILIAACFVLCLAAVALLFPQAFHLWGDGALRLRNLRTQTGVAASGLFEPGDTLLHMTLVGAGMRPEASFLVTGLLAGLVYAASLLLISAREPDGGRVSTSWRAIAWAAPVWTVMFSGYVESYGPFLSLACLTLAILITGGRSALAAAAMAMCCFFHLMGLLLLPSVVLYWWKRRNAERAATPLILALTVSGCAVWLLLASPAATGHPGGALSLVHSPLQGLRQLAFTLVFAAPVVPLLLPSIRLKGLATGAGAALPSALLGLVLVVLWSPARGMVRDWDILALLLMPLFVWLIASQDFGRRLTRMAALAGLILGSTRMGIFHSGELALEHYRRSLATELSASAAEELAIYLRDLGDLQTASALFREAFEIEGNGRHLAQASEVERIMGNQREALELARRAVAEREDLAVAHQQLLYAACDAGLPAEALSAATAACSLAGDDPMIWGKALECAVIGNRPDLGALAAERVLSCGGDTIPAIVTNLGVLAYQRGDREEAIRYFERACQLDPSDPLPRRNLEILRGRS